MPNETNPRRLLYWDSCVFISYFSRQSDRIATLEQILEEVATNDQSTIFTSTETITEVAYVEIERRQRRIDPVVESMFDQMWNDTSIVQMIEFNPFLARSARDLIRNSIITPGRTLKPKDAIHLATAQWINNSVTPINAFNTYDQQLLGYTKPAGLVVCEPNVIQPRLPYPGPQPTRG